LSGVGLGIHCILPSHTHTHTHTHFVHYMSGALYPGLSWLKLEGIM